MSALNSILAPESQAFANETLRCYLSGTELSGSIAAKPDQGLVTPADC
jgi:hypothetical protein